MRIHKIHLRPYAVILFIVLLLYTISLFVPFVWSLLGSLKSRRDFTVNAFGFPEQLMFSNYQTAFLNFYVEVQTSQGWHKVYMDQMMVNSLLYAVSCAFVSTFVCCCMAYVSSKYRYRCSKLIYTVVLVTMILPIVGSLPSELQVARSLGIYDNIWGMWIMKANCLSMYFLVFFAIFKSLPWDFAESAFVDGASDYRVMFAIMFPMVRTTFSTVFLLFFIQYWNDYQTPMIFLPSMPTAAYGMFLYQFSHVNEINSVPMQLAGCMILMIPILVIFLLFKNRLMGNLTMGGLKG